MYIFFKCLKLEIGPRGIYKSGMVGSLTAYHLTQLCRILEIHIYYQRVKHTLLIGKPSYFLRLHWSK